MKIFAVSGLMAACMLAGAGHAAGLPPLLPNPTELPHLAIGKLWIAPNNIGPSLGGNYGYDATSAPAGDPDVMFYPHVISFAGDALVGNTFTVGGFLSSLNAVPSSPSPFVSYSGQVNSALAGAAVTSSTPLIDSSPFGYSTVIEITGDLFLYPGATYLVINHDDGVSLKLNGQLVPGFKTDGGVPFPGEFVNFSTLGIGPGLVSFDLIYAESFSSPAVLQLELPEPATLGILGFSLVGLIAARYRRTPGTMA